MKGAAIKSLTERHQTGRAVVGWFVSPSLLLCHLAPSYKYVMMFNAGVGKKIKDLPESVGLQSFELWCVEEEGRSV